MKQSLRKILATLVLAVSVFSLTACGSTTETITYDEAQLRTVADALIQVWDAMSEEEIEEFVSLYEDDVEEMIDYYAMYDSPFGYFTADSLIGAFSAYQASMDDLGAYVSTDGYDEPEVSGDEITLVTHITYEQRTATLTLVFNERSIVESTAVDPSYSLGEIGQKALMNTLIGMGTVFCVLIFISLIIYCFNFIPKIQAKFSKKKEPENVPKPAPAPVKTETPAPAAEELVDDGELVAAITAAICAYSGTSSDGFVVRSIRRADSANWKRA